MQADLMAAASGAVTLLTVPRERGESTALTVAPAEESASFTVVPTKTSPEYELEPYFNLSLALV